VHETGRKADAKEVEEAEEVKEAKDKRPPLPGAAFRVVVSSFILTL